MRIGAVYPQTEAGGDPDNVRAFGLAVESMGLDHVLAFDMWPAPAMPIAIRRSGGPTRSTTLSTIR